MANQTLKLYGLKESQDGSFYGVPNSVLIQAYNIKEARTIADKITKGGFSKYSGFYHLSKETIKIYTPEILA